MPRKELPHNPEAEQAVLGAILLNPECFHEVAEILGGSSTLRRQTEGISKS